MSTCMQISPCMVSPRLTLCHAPLSSRLSAPTKRVKQPRTSQLQSKMMCSTRPSCLVGGCSSPLRVSTIGVSCRTNTLHTWASGQVLLCYSTMHSYNICLMQNQPPNSPNPNLVEHVRAWVDAKVYALGCKTFEQYQQAVLDQLQAVPKTMLSNLVDSMPKHLAQFIELDGGRTKY